MKSIPAKDLAALDGKTVGTTHDTWLTKNVKNAKVVRYEDDATTAQAFVSGQVDLFTTAEFLLGPIAKKAPARELELKFVLESFKLGIGVRKGETALLQKVNEWVKVKLKNGKLNEIYGVS